MPDLHEWITQQIDRVELVARRASAGLGTVLNQIDYQDDAVTADEQHIALHDPASVLRRCASDRKILEVHAPQGGDWEPYACLGCGTDSEYGVLVDHTNDCETLQALAEGYGLTEEQRTQLDRPEPEPRQRRMGGFLGAGIAEAMYGNLIATFIGTRPAEPRPEVKAMEILAPELKKIPGYVPTTEEQP